MATILDNYLARGTVAHIEDSAIFDRVAIYVGNNEFIDLAITQGGDLIPEWTLVKINATEWITSPGDCENGKRNPKAKFSCCCLGTTCVGSQEVYDRALSMVGQSLSIMNTFPFVRGCLTGDFQTGQFCWDRTLQRIAENSGAHSRE
ncbi:hypothetical protein [Helicobacter sp. L8]|uniref:hypothetical protein n=1 Tax=Helicobacter sp. L8 TaxID=2316078 RepID=UPI000EAC77B4|nr:hypothetical protein [Helicobacter sp. L8]